MTAGGPPTATEPRAVILFDAHAAGLHRYLARRAGPEDADDLVLAACHSARPRTTSAAAERAVLFGTATTLLHRRPARRSGTVADGSSGGAAARDPSTVAGPSSGGRPGDGAERSDDRTGNGSGGGARCATDDPDLTGRDPDSDRERDQDQERADRIDDGLAALPHDQLDVLLLAAWGGFDPSDVAVALDLRVDTVDVLLRRARLALRDGSWSDAQLDGALAEFRSGVVSDATTLATLRRRVVDEQGAAGDIAQGVSDREQSVPPHLPLRPAVAELARPDGDRPDSTRPDSTRQDSAGPGRNGPRTAAPSRRRLQALVSVGVVGVVAVVLGSALGDPGVDGTGAQPATPAATTTAPIQRPTQPFRQLPAATEVLSPGVAELGRAGVDAPVGPGQYLYRRVASSNDQWVEEEWIPADPADEWLRRFTATPLVDTDDVDTPDERAPLGAYRGQRNDGLLRDGRSLTDLPRDPLLLYAELRRATGLALDPHLDALQRVLDLLRSEPVPVDLRSALFVALGYVPYLTVLTEDGYRTAVIRADGAPFGRLVRVELLVDVATGQMSGERFADSTGAYETRISFAVADEIGVPPGG